MLYETEQEKFLAGEFGTKYIGRNNSEGLLYSKVVMWGQMLKSANAVGSAREFGCNIGLNLIALKKLNSSIELSGYEINEEAARQASELNVATIHRRSILEEIDEARVDLTFTVGVLIHINPDHLDRVYNNLVRGTSKYVLVAEYYNPTPMTVTYRGHHERLFKRDFAGELIDKYSLKLVDYGFLYERDNFAPQGNLTWFLLQK